MAFDPVAFKHTKHIMRAAEFLRALVARLYITLDHIDGAQNAADVMTKAQARAVFCSLVMLLRDASKLLV